MRGFCHQASVPTLKIFYGRSRAECGAFQAGARARDAEEIGRGKRQGAEPGSSRSRLWDAFCAILHGEVVPYDFFLRIFLVLRNSW